MKSFIVRNYNGFLCIDSLSLYRALKKSSAHYNRWAADLNKLGDENIDFFKQKSMIFDQQEHRIVRRYHITLQFACELAASSKTEIGRQLKYEFRRLLFNNINIKAPK